MPQGRETKLTPEVQKLICDAIAAGNYDYVAAEYAGICQATFYGWLARGEDAKSGIHLEFLEAVRKAQSQAEVRNIAIIETDPSWQSKAWWLERKFPDRWGRKDKVAVSGDAEHPVVHVHKLEERLAAYGAIVEAVSHRAITGHTNGNGAGKPLDTP